MGTLKSCLNETVILGTQVNRSIRKYMYIQFYIQKCFFIFAYACGLNVGKVVNVNLSYDVAPESEITPCIKNDKTLVV